MILHPGLFQLPLHARDPAQLLRLPHQRTWTGTNVIKLFSHFQIS
jgi:hypothetical protein